MSASQAAAAAATCVVPTHCRFEHKKAPKTLNFDLCTTIRIRNRALKKERNKKIKIPRLNNFPFFSLRNVPSYDGLISLVFLYTQWCVSACSSHRGGCCMGGLQKKKSWKITAQWLRFRVQNVDRLLVLRSERFFFVFL